MILSNPRQTGRTTRMVEHAKKLAVGDQIVIIVTWGMHDRARIQDMVVGHPNIRVKSYKATAGFIDWARMQFKEDSPLAAAGYQLLVDHQVLHDLIANQYKMMTQFDAPPEEAKNLTQHPSVDQHMRFLEFESEFQNEQGKGSS